MNHFDENFPIVTERLKKEIAESGTFFGVPKTPNPPNPAPYVNSRFGQCYTDRSLNPFIFAYHHNLIFGKPYDQLWNPLEDPDTEADMIRCLRAGHLCEPNRLVYFSDDTIDEYQNEDLDPVLDLENWYLWNHEMRTDDPDYGDLIHILTIRDCYDRDFLYLDPLLSPEGFMTLINSGTGVLNIAVDVADVGDRLTQFREFRSYLFNEMNGFPYNFETTI